LRCAPASRSCRPALTLIGHSRPLTPVCAVLVQRARTLLLALHVPKSRHYRPTDIPVPVPLVNRPCARSAAVGEPQARTARDESPRFSAGKGANGAGPSIARPALKRHLFLGKNDGSSAGNRPRLGQGVSGKSGKRSSTITPRMRDRERSERVFRHSWPPANVSPAHPAAADGAILRLFM